MIGGQYNDEECGPTLVDDLKQVLSVFGKTKSYYPGKGVHQLLRDVAYDFPTTSGSEKEVATSP